MLLRGPGGGRPAPAAFAEVCLRRLGVLAAGGSSGSSNGGESGGGNAQGPNGVQVDWRLAEALLKLLGGLATALKISPACHPPRSTVAVSGAAVAAAAEAAGSEAAAAAAASAATASADAAARAALVSVLNRPGLTADLLPLLAHGQASVRRSY